MKLILACTPSGGIGYHNHLPWKSLRGDLPRFKTLTDGQTIVMGRNTWNSLPVKPLRNRANLVVSNEVVNGGTAISLDQVPENAIVIGGAQLVKTLLPKINLIYLSRTYIEYPCDTFIDLKQIERDFELVSKQSLSDHYFETWNRI